MKKILFGILLGVIISGTITYAALKIQANEVGYKNGTVEDALDNLYNQVSSKKTVCMLLSGTANTIGAKYACNPGDGIIRNFYLLKVDGNEIKLIMEKNISSNMNHANALVYFTTGAGVSTKNAWTNVTSVDLPSAQDIVDASLAVNPKQDWSFDISTASDDWWCLGSHVQDQPSGPTYCPTSTAQQKISWLFNYTNECSSRGCSNNDSSTYGYWTKDKVSDNDSSAWLVDRIGYLSSGSVSYASLGVRPVITILKSGLSG